MRFRGGLAMCGVAAFAGSIAIVVVACSDDADSFGPGSTDGGADVIVNPNPTTTVPPPNFPDAPAPPPDLVSRSALMGNAVLVADVGEPTDGPTWRDADNALYFTVPGSANGLRRVVPDGGAPTTVAVDAGGPFAPIGVATGSGSKLFVSEREAIVTLDVDDAGTVTSFARTTGPGGTQLSDIAAVPPTPTSYAVDIGEPGVYQFTPPSTLGLRIDMPDAGRTTAIHVRKTFTQDLEIFVGASGTKQGNAIVVFRDEGTGLALADEFPTGIPINGLAVDDIEHYFVAWAKGINVVNGGGSVPQDGEATLPIAAIPTNLTFGGPDGKTLFVTTAKGKIYAIPVKTKGQPR